MRRLLIPQHPGRPASGTIQPARTQHAPSYSDRTDACSAGERRKSPCPAERSSRREHPHRTRISRRPGKAAFMFRPRMRQEDPQCRTDAPPSRPARNLSAPSPVGGHGSPRDFRESVLRRLLRSLNAAPAGLPPRPAKNRSRRHGPFPGTCRITHASVPEALPHKRAPLLPSASAFSSIT